MKNENFITCSSEIDREIYDKFKSICYKHGKTVKEALIDHMIFTIENSKMHLNENGEIIICGRNSLDVERELFELMKMFGDYDHVNFEISEGHNVFICKDEKDLEMVLNNSLMKDIGVFKTNIKSDRTLRSNKVGFSIPNEKIENRIKPILFRCTKLF